MHHADTLRAIDDLLDRERGVLLSGDFERIAALAAEKEHLLTEFAQQQHDINALRHLRIKTQHNATLHGATLRGIRGALNRLDALRKGITQLDTYDIVGQRQHLGHQANGTLEKKA